MYLTNQQFASIIDQTPLVSIDLIFLNSANQILLGQRNNAPAKGYWFVPGGRIRKNETLTDAFKRLTHDEIGMSKAYKDAISLGVYEHFYDDNALTIENISTHYVVIAKMMQIDNLAIDALPTDQHNAYKFFSLEELCSNRRIHTNSRAYYDAIIDNLPKR